ncbi:kinase-like protein [Stipitochalara longipes BDJ]|nr:kinase-like protein [Stipitochalara longipes BDJ]
MLPSAGDDEGPRCSIARHHIKGFLVGDENRPRQRFVPVDKLRTYLTRSTVTWLLECKCPTCSKDHALFRRGRTEFIGSIVGPENDSNTQPDPSKTALALFALLIYIEHPLLILGFVIRRCSDHGLERTPTSFSIEHLRREYCEEYANRVGDRHFKEFANDFAEHLPKFAIPRMDSGEYSVYGPDTILPFLNEQKIGVRGRDGEVHQEGAHGKVYSFEIYEEYRQFPHAKEYNKFARKELDSSSELAFTLENKNLDQATTLQDRHIVKMIKAYKHGDTFNLIFPLAKTNLDHLLRNPALDTSNSIHGPVESRTAWNQLLGITKALGRIGGPNGAETIFGPSDKQQFQGVHFDLKPANILVDDDGTWIISDFGQSTFRETTRSSSRVINQGGTDAYAPPEIDNLDSRFSRRYDVWSLGCIMLEVMAFVLLGHEGLHGEKGLDHVRFTRSSWSSRKDHRFFCQESPQGKCVVKKEIVSFMKSLKESECLRGQQKSRVFVESILELITKMLEPEAEYRIEIGDVIRRLNSAIDTAREDSQMLGQMNPVHGERSIGEADLKSIRIWHSRQNDWQSVSLRIFEDSDHNLRTCTVLKNNTAPSEDHLIRSMVMIVPRYAFRDKETSATAIYFSHVSLGGPERYPGSVFSFDKSQDAWLMQTALTGQKVEASFPLENIKYQQFISLGGRISRLLKPSKDEKKEGGYKDLGPGTVQLWSEVTPDLKDEEKPKSIASSSGGSRRPVRMQPHQQPGYRQVPLRRMVIYLHNLRKIIIVTMDRNWHEDNKRGAEESPEFLHFKPRNPARDPSFVATTLLPLKPDDPTSFAGIPLCSAILRGIEDQNRFECDSIGLTFRNEGSRRAFSETYRLMWKEWYTQTKEAERQPGYTPVTPPLQLAPIPEQSQPKLPSKSHSWKFLRASSTNVTKETGSSSREDAILHAPHRGGGRGGSRRALKNGETLP